MKKLFKILSTSGDTLKQRVLISGFWVAFFKIIERTLRFIKTIIIARLLAPNDFGLFGIACLSMEIFQTFTETGIQSALVQKKGDIKPYLDTAWTIQLLRGIGLFVVVFIFAPQFGRFFNNLEAVPVIRAIAFNMLFYGLTNIGITYFEKEIEFGKQRLVDFARLTVEFIVSLSLAFILRNAWALVWGMLAGRIANCLASYIAHPYRPKLDFDIKRAKELIHFGKWIFASSILIFLITQGDDILVGRILGATALGLYTMAYAISNLATTEITHLVSQVMFPVYSKMQDKIITLRDGYLKVLKVVTSLSFLVTVLVIFLGKDFVALVLGLKWTPMVLSMQILAVWGFARSVGATTGPIFVALGKPKLATKLQLWQLALMALTIYPLTVRYNIAGTSLAIVVPIIIVNIVSMKWAMELVSISKYDLFKCFICPAMSAMCAVITLVIIKSAGSNGNLKIIGFLFSLFASVAVYSVSYFVFIRSIDKDYYNYFKGLRKIFSRNWTQQKIFGR